MLWCCKGVFEESGARGCAESDLQKLKTLVAWSRARKTSVFRDRKARVLESALVPAWGLFRSRCGECSLTCGSCVHGKTNQVTPGRFGCPLGYERKKYSNEKFGWNAAWNVGVSRGFLGLPRERRGGTPRVGGRARSLRLTLARALVEYTSYLYLYSYSYT